MALPIGMTQLIETSLVESHRKEYKEGWDPDSTLRTICAFANDYDNVFGGYIIIGMKAIDGVPDLQSFVGLEKNQIDGIEKELTEKCHAIRPFYLPEISVETYQGKTLLVLWVAPGLDRPYQAREFVTKKGSFSHYYIRSGSSTIQAKDAQIRELFDMASFIPFDERPCYKMSCEDLSKELLREHLRRVGSSLYGQSQEMSAKQIAEKMHLLAGPREFQVPENVAALMFSYRINDIFPEAKIEITYLPEPTGKSMTVRTFDGPIQYQLEAALREIKNNVIAEKIIKVEGQAEALHIANYPYAAIEEILPNAVYHRDYRIAEPISVLVTPEYIEIKSFPGFDSSIKEEAIVQGLITSSAPYRNRSIGNYLKELGLTEGKNTGIPTAREACRANGSPLPLFLMDAERNSLRVRLFAHNAFSTIEEKRKRNAHQEELTQEILAILANGPQSLLEISKKMGYQSVSQALRKAMQRLLEHNSVLRSGKQKSTRYSLNKKD